MSKVTLPEIDGYLIKGRKYVSIEDLEIALLDVAKQVEVQGGPITAKAVRLVVNDLLIPISASLGKSDTTNPKKSYLQKWIERIR